MTVRTNDKSGQAIIFLMVVLVLGLFVVIWNFDLHRIVMAKNRLKTAGDAAALTAARWQGITLNMIGDLNLIQAAILSSEFEDAYNPETREFEVPAEVPILHDLRERLAFIGPLAAYALAQQSALNNRALSDPELAEDLKALAATIRFDVDEQPYPNAFADYADLLEYVADHGVVASAHAPRLPRHVLADINFYNAIAAALAGNWCPFRKYRYYLENYDGFDFWNSMPEEIEFSGMLDLKLEEYISAQPADVDRSNVIFPSVAIPPNAQEYFEQLEQYFESDEETGIIPNYGDPDYAIASMQNLDFFVRVSDPIVWHVYSYAWARRWPKATYYDEETGEYGGDFPLRTDVREEYNYLGAESGFALYAPVSRGILSSSGNETVDLKYITKAKPFGYLVVDGIMELPYYFGFVFPAFNEEYLVHSDIGDPVLDHHFYRHVVLHLYDYLEGGVDALDPECEYCELLAEWEILDREAGVEWLDRADGMAQDPCEPRKGGGGGSSSGRAGGGASGGS